MTRIAELLTQLPGWLAATSGADVATGLSRSEAVARAAKLRKELESSETVGDVNVDEDSKDAVYALVDLLEGDCTSPGPEAFAQANAAYQYLADSPWVLDEFGERHDLMRRCARLGWWALGLDIEGVESIRTNPGQGRFVTFELCIPEAIRFDYLGILAIAERGRELVKRMNAEPGMVADRLASLYEEHTRQIFGRRLIDVAEYLLGAIALLAAGAFRMAGAFAAAETWLETAARRFAKTTKPEPLLVRVLCERLVVMFGRRQHREACEVAPWLISETKRLGMQRDSLRSRLVYGAVLRSGGNYGRAIDELSTLRAELDSGAEATMLVSTLANLADALTAEGRFDEAAKMVEEGYRIASGSHLSLEKPHLDSVAGQLLRRQGRFPEAIVAFRLSASRFQEMGAKDCEAEVRVPLAESLVAAKRYREAQMEIKRSMPILEACGMVAETLAAIVILRDSRRREKLDRERSNLRD